MARGRPGQGHGPGRLAFPSRLGRWGHLEVSSTPPEGGRSLVIRKVAVRRKFQDALPLPGAIGNSDPFSGAMFPPSTEALEHDPAVPGVSLGGPTRHIQKGGTDPFLGPLSPRGRYTGGEILGRAARIVHRFPSLPGFTVQLTPVSRGRAWVLGFADTTAGHRIVVVLVSGDAPGLPAFPRVGISGSMPLGSLVPRRARMGGFTHSPSMKRVVIWAPSWIRAGSIRPGVREVSGGPLVGCFFHVSISDRRSSWERESGSARSGKPDSISEEQVPP